MTEQKIYIGTSSKSTFNVIAQYKNVGVCLNMYNFNQKAFEHLESLNQPIFLDNGSFERFTAFLKGEMKDNKYFDYDTAKTYFSVITTDYENLLKEAKHPENIILTIPEVIGSSELTQSLQTEYINSYKGFELKYKCRIIISLQFNPNSQDWIRECVSAGEFIKATAPSNWIVGIPFGNDFKILQKEKIFNVIRTIFKGLLRGYKAHLFACGSINKIKKYVKDNLDFISSIDASTIMNLAKYSHYLSYSTQKVFDIRALKAKTVSEKTAQIKLDIMEQEGLTLEELESLKYIERFELTMKNFSKIMVYFKIMEE